MRLKASKNSTTGEKYIGIRDTKAGKKYSVELYIKDKSALQGRRKVKIGTFETLPEAVARRDVVLAEIKAGTYVHPFKAGGKRYTKEMIAKINHLAVTTDMTVTDIAKEVGASDKGIAAHVKKARADIKTRINDTMSISYLLTKPWTPEALAGLIA